MSAWTERSLGGLVAFAPRSLPPGLLIAFSGRGMAPPGETSPTALLARGLADALALGDIPIVRPTQVHGNRSIVIRQRPPRGEVLDAGPCDVLATDLSGIALVVQTADCVPIVLAGTRSISVAHAGWRGSAVHTATAAVSALAALDEDPRDARAWLGPSIGPCCYKVGGEVAAQFAGDFVRRECGGSFRLDLAAVNRAQLEAAGISSENIQTHPACTRCGGEKYASYRRDGAKAGRMIALVARLSPDPGGGRR